MQVDESFPPNKSHHVGSPPTSFQNPWPSFDLKSGSLMSILHTRFSSERNFVPVPETREELVKVRKPDWGQDASPSSLKATWIGHASWLVEFPGAATSGQKDGQQRGVRVLFDPVFSERTSPFTFLGPKRYTPTPCSLAELPEIDVVAISHNHYDHLDIDTIKGLQTRFARTIFLCPLGLRAWFTGIGISGSRVIECDWWNGIDVHVQAKGSIRMVCTPAQHFSQRGIGDRNCTLWCSWSVGALPASSSRNNDEQDKTITTTRYEVPHSFEQAETEPVFGSPRLYFTGDSGYRMVKERDPTPEEAAKYPYCPAFSTIGRLLGPFDLALVPIGLYSPRDHMSGIHCSPDDSVLLAKDVRAKLAVGMHYGTVRGGLSAQYEDVREPPRRFRAACEREGLKWGIEAALCDVGETVVVA